MKSHYLKEERKEAEAKSKCSKKLIIFACLALAISLGFILKLLLSNNDMQLQINDLEDQQEEYVTQIESEEQTIAEDEETMEQQTETIANEEELLNENREEYDQ